MSQSEYPTRRFINRQQLESKVPIKRERIRQLEMLGKFPKRIALSSRKNVWLESEIDAWIAARVAESRKEVS